MGSRAQHSLVFGRSDLVLALPKSNRFALSNWNYFSTQEISGEDIQMVINITGFDNSEQTVFVNCKLTRDSESLH